MKKYRHAKSKGNDAEKIVKTWLQEIGETFTQEDTRRGKTKGTIDFEGANIGIEVKVFTGLLTYKLGSQIHDIHFDQICYLYKKRFEKVCGFLITEDTETFYFIPIMDFMTNLVNSTRKSINVDIAEKIGYKVTNSRELKNVLDELRRLQCLKK